MIYLKCDSNFFPVMKLPPPKKTPNGRLSPKSPRNKENRLFRRPYDNVRSITSAKVLMANRPTGLKGKMFVIVIDSFWPSIALEKTFCLNCLTSYLSHRFQSFLSFEVSVSSGAPQGSHIVNVYYTTPLYNLT